MYEMINLIVCTILMLIFIIGALSCLVLNSKYNGILKTIDGKFVDKDVMLIEHLYRHKVVSNNRPYNTKSFVEKSINDIKIGNIGTTTLEDLSINTFYLTILIGFIFTFIEIASLNKVTVNNLPDVLLSGIIGLILGLVLLATRMICRLDEKKELSILYLCNHLDNEFKIVMDGVKVANEGYSADEKVKKYYKENTKNLFMDTKDNKLIEAIKSGIYENQKNTTENRKDELALNEKDFEDIINELIYK